MDIETPSESGGLSRRVVVKRIGAGAALTWSAPALLTMQSRAYAGSAVPNTCQPGQDSCTGADFTCNGLARCFCTNTKEGSQICGCLDRGQCSGYQLCTASSQCPPGEFCTTGDHCCGGICVPLCSATCGGGQAGSAGAGTPGVPPTA